MATFRASIARTAIAAIALAGFAIAPAAAETSYTSPDGRVSLTMPDGWFADLMSEPNAGVFHLAIGTAAQECRVVLPVNPVTATISVETLLRTYKAPFTAAQWGQVIETFPFVRGGVLISSAVDESGFWPHQTAVIQHEGRTVYGAITGRLGYDIYSFCTTFDGPDAPAVYDTVRRSIGAAGDTAAQAAYEERANVQPAPASAPATPIERGG